MQNKSFTLTGGGATITAPSGCEAFDLVSTAAFNATYADFTQPKSVAGIGDAAPAVQVGTGAFAFRVYAPRGYAFALGQIIALVTGATQPIVAVPVRFGN